LPGTIKCSCRRPGPVFPSLEVPRPQNRLAEPGADEGPNAVQGKEGCRISERDGNPCRQGKMLLGIAAGRANFIHGGPIEAFLPARSALLLDAFVSRNSSCARLSSVDFLCFAGFRAGRIAVSDNGEIPDPVLPDQFPHPDSKKPPARENTMAGPELSRNFFVLYSGQVFPEKTDNKIRQKDSGYKRVIESKNCSRC
jgi:hypothetical protein